MICNVYPHLLRNLLHKVRCTTQPAENSTPGNESRSSSKVSPEQQLSTSQLQSNESGRKSEFVTYPAQTSDWIRDFKLTEQARREMWVNYFFFLASFSTAKKQRKSPNAWWEVHSANICECQFYVSRDFLKYYGDLSANPLWSESCVNALVLSKGVNCKQMWRNVKGECLHPIWKKVFSSFTIKVLNVSYFNFAFSWNVHMFHNNGYCQWLFCLDATIFVFDLVLIFHIEDVELIIWNKDCLSTR